MYKLRFLALLLVVGNIDCIEQKKSQPGSILRYDSLFPAKEYMHDSIPIQYDGQVDDAYRTEIVEYEEQTVGFMDRETGEIHRLEGVLLVQHRYASTGKKGSLFSLWQTNVFNDPRFKECVIESDQEMFIRARHPGPDGKLEDLPIIPFAKKDFMVSKFPKDKLPGSPIHYLNWGNSYFKGFIIENNRARRVVPKLLYTTSRPEADKKMDAVILADENKAAFMDAMKKPFALVEVLKKKGWDYRKTQMTRSKNPLEDVD